MATERLPASPQRARLTRQGQITVPKAVRDALGARPGDDIEFVSRGGDVVVEIRPRRSILEFAGIAAGRAGRVPATAEELDDLIGQGMAEAAVAREERAVIRETRRGSRRRQGS